MIRSSGASAPRRVLSAAAPWVALALLAAGLVPLLAGRRGFLLVGGLLAALVAMFVVHRPHWGVWIILVTWFLEVDPIGIRYLSIPYLVTALLLVPLALALLRGRGVWVLHVPQIAMFVAIGTLFVVSTWWSDFAYPITLLPEVDETARQLTLFASRLVFLVLFLYFIATPRRMEVTAGLLVVLIVIAAITALVPYLGSGGTRRASAAFGMATNANRLGFMCLFGASLVWCYRTHAVRPRWRLPALAAAILLPVTAATSGSRSTFLQMLVFATFIVLGQPGWSAARRARTAGLLLGVGLLAATAVQSVHLVRATTFDPSSPVPGQRSLVNRINRLQAALGMIAGNPVVGIGVGNFQWMYRTYYGPGGEQHNSYLWATTGGGPGALGLYLALFLVTYRRLRALERGGRRDLAWLARAMRLNLLLFAVFSAFADFFLSEFLYLIVGFAVALSEWHAREARAAAAPAAPLAPALRLSGAVLP